MKSNGIIKRIFFFLAAFAIGVTITGLLFGFQVPRFGHRHREGKRQYVRQLKSENERLRTENSELRQQVNSHLGVDSSEKIVRMGPFPLEEFAPPPPPIPKSPPAPHKHK